MTKRIKKKATPIRAVVRGAQAIGVLATVVAVLACGESPAPTSRQLLVDSIASVCDELETPDGLAQRGHPTEDNFAVDTYFELLDRLTVQDGYSLDYVYRTVPLGGLPVIYARKVGSPRFKSYDEFERARAGADATTEYAGMNLAQHDETRGPNHPWREWIQHVKTDGTPEGFFQLTVLSIMGPQFYLEWHANYDDLRLVCDQAGLEAILDGRYFDRRLPRDVRRAAAQLGLDPTIHMNPDSVDVSLVVFTKWGGFLRRTVSFSREFPHQLLEQVDETLVEYSCGVRF